MPAVEATITLCEIIFKSVVFNDFSIVTIIQRWWKRRMRKKYLPSYKYIFSFDWKNVFTFKLHSLHLIVFLELKRHLSLCFSGILTAMKIIARSVNFLLIQTSIISCTILFLFFSGNSACICYICSSVHHHFIIHMHVLLSVTRRVYVDLLCVVYYCFSVLSKHRNIIFYTKYPSQWMFFNTYIKFTIYVFLSLIIIGPLLQRLGR